MNELMTRRHFSKWLGCSTVGCGAISVLGLSSLHSFAGGSASIHFTKVEMETLAHYSYQLLPVLEPDNERYRVVVSALVTQSIQRPGVASLLREGIEALNATGEGNWLNLSPLERTVIVSRQAGTPFFNLLRWTTTEIVMRDPIVWKQVGYQGSSIEFGGYLHRGFNDINWLPTSNQELDKEKRQYENF